jgi:hypothetical protein
MKTEDRRLSIEDGGNREEAPPFCAALCQAPLAKDRWGKPRHPMSGRTLPAQSMTIWSILERGRDSVRGDLGLRRELREGLSGWARKSAVQPAEPGRLGNCSLISSCFHLFPLASAVWIIKIFLQNADACPGGIQAAGTETRVNYLKLA